jgi:hypothetical protein
MVQQFLILVNFFDVQLIDSLEFFNFIGQRYALTVLFDEFLLDFEKGLFALGDLLVFVGDLYLVERLEVVLDLLF